MNDAAPVSTENFEAICRKCRQPFFAIQVEVLGVVLTSRVCEQCSARSEIQEKDAIERRRQAQIMRDATAREEAWAKFCPKEFRLTTEAGGNTSLARLELEQPKTKDLLAWKGPRGLILRGPSGKCKTRAMWRLVRRLWIEGSKTYVLTAGQFDRQCRDAGGNFTLTSWFNRLAEVYVFVLDDLGKGQWTPATEATWFDLVDERTRENRPIIVTTNDTGETLADRMSPERAEALIRRLRDYCDTIVFL